MLFKPHHYADDLPLNMQVNRSLWKRKEWTSSTSDDLNEKNIIKIMTKTK